TKDLDQTPLARRRENYALKTKLRFLTEEGHTRARNTFQRVRLFAAFMFLAAALTGVALHFYWVKPNLTPLQRIYLRQYVRSTFKGYMPRSRSRYTFLTGVVRDPSTGRDVRIMMHDGLVKADFDDEGRIKVKNGYPVFYLNPNAEVKEFAWTNEFLIDATAYGCFRRLIYDDQSLIDLWRPAWLGHRILSLWHGWLDWPLHVCSTPLRRRPTPPRHARALPRTVSQRAPETSRLRPHGLSAGDESTHPSARLFRFQAARLHVDRAPRRRERRAALTRR